MNVLHTYAQIAGPHKRKHLKHLSCNNLASHATRTITEQEREKRTRRGENEIYCHDKVKIHDMDNNLLEITFTLMYLAIELI